MHIIPVIDLKGGLVVRARMGQREFYRPIETPLAATADPVDIVAGLLAVYPFATIYVADLDAIGGTGDNSESLARVKRAFPQVALWLDNGVADVEAATEWLRQDRGFLVLGSETQTSAAVIRHFCEDRRIVLSLDFRGTEFQGPPELLEDTGSWPQRVIAMTLNRVGSLAGPDIGRLRAVKATAVTRQVYAAGGVRDADDLRILAQVGIAGALIASSLHDGRITAEDLHQLA